MIKKAAEKLKKLSDDQEVKNEYKRREGEMARIREERIIEEIKSLDFDDGVYAEPGVYRVRVRDLYNYCKERGIPVGSLNKNEAMMFVERKVEGKNE